MVSRDPEQAERERRWAQGRRIKNTPTVMRVRLDALEKWSAELDERLATLEAGRR